ncbi:hypothetical protein MC885_013795 [Smutsia gigantea]|nr:hypothetical protein MC885_013795 [Smutsia gigantea]
MPHRLWTGRRLGPDAVPPVGEGRCWTGSCRDPSTPGGPGGGAGAAPPARVRLGPGYPASRRSLGLPARKRLKIPEDGKCLLHI